MKILYAMSALYPYGTPYAARVTNFCRLLRLAGHEVIVFCDYYTDNRKNKKEKKEIFENNEIFFSAEKRDFISKCTVMYITPRKIESYLKNNEIDLVIVSSAANRFKKILNICRKYNIVMVLEINEKYHYSNWGLGKFDIRYYQFKKCWNTEYQKADGFITISSFLEKHFQKYGKPVIKIPTIMDVRNSEEHFRTYKYNAEQVHFNFTGGLGGGKDLLGEFIFFLTKRITKRKFVLDIYGPDKKSVEKQAVSQGLSSIDDKVATIYGRISQKEVPYKIATSDYGLILRPNRESSNAGFPTKIAEYMAVGTPVIANPTSDIAKYILSGVNGFLIEDLSENSIEKVLKIIDEMKKEDYLKMREEARKTALKSFDYRLFKDYINEFLFSVRYYNVK